MPQPVAALVAELPGRVAVVLGGSRATGTHRPDSDWDLGLYYRGSQRPLDPDDIRRLGHEGYVWGRGPIVNGGAWLNVEHRDRRPLPRPRCHRALERGGKHGRYDVLVQTGYVVGAPTYLPVGELAICQLLVGTLPRLDFPPPLAISATSRWRGVRTPSLMFATISARLGDVVSCAGMLVDALLSAAHARLAERREWVLNEKRLVHRAGLQDVVPVLARPGATSTDPLASVAFVTAALQIEPLTGR